LGELVADLRQGKTFQVTRLLSLKTLCAKPEDAQAFAFHLATLAREQLEGERAGREVDASVRAKFKEPVAAAIKLMRRHLERSRPKDDGELRDQLHVLAALQNEEKNIPYGVARIIECMPALVVEKALKCMLWPQQAPHLAYEIARDFCERYDPSYGTGLIPASAPMVEEVADFWSRRHLDQPLKSLAAVKKREQKPRIKKRPVEPSQKNIAATFSEMYPAIASWVKDGWVEIGMDDNRQSFIRALDVGGQIWEGKPRYPSLEDALADLEAGITQWLKENS
jgi:hypothetical protein